MANPQGGNGVMPPNPYGAVKQLTELTRSAPMSGAPVSGRALSTPRRAQKAGAGRPAAATPAVAAGPPAPGPQPASQVPDDVQVALAWKAAAQATGASELVKAYAAQASREAGLG